MTVLDVQWAVAARPFPGEIECGDACGATRFGGGVLFAVVDGLGHGPAAAEAARLVVETLGAEPGAPLVEQVRRCHEAVRRSRGAVMSLASFSAARAELTWLGIGNVEGALFTAPPTQRPARHTLLLRGGVVGSKLPPLVESRLPLFSGDTLVFATDGVRWRAPEPRELEGSLDAVATGLLERHATHTDDALVLVARFHGQPG